MYGPGRSGPDLADYLGLLRAIQKETSLFAEFVPLRFIHSEAPMYR